MARFRSRREQQHTEAYERQRPDDAGSRGHACEGGSPQYKPARVRAVVLFAYGISAKVQTEPPAGTDSAA
jgi:hypothetical protein